MVTLCYVLANLGYLSVLHIDQIVDWEKCGVFLITLEGIYFGGRASQGLCFISGDLLDRRAILLERPLSAHL